MKIIKSRGSLSPDGKSRAGVASISDLGWLAGGEYKYLVSKKGGGRGRPKWKESYLAVVLDKHRYIMDRISEIKLAMICNVHQNTVYRWRERGIPMQYWKKLVLAGVCSWDEIGINEVMP